MAGITGVSAYQQTNRSWDSRSKGAERSNAAAASKATGSESGKESVASKVETREFSPIEAGSLCIPRKTEYGMTVGDVKLSDKAADYLKSLKSKFGNMEFVTVSKDMKDQVQKNAMAYGNANKMVVLIDDEKLEKMATDDAFRKKYEGIIAMSANKLQTAKNSLTSTGASVKNFGMSVDSNGKESFFATVEKASQQQKERIEKKAAEKKEQKLKEKKKAEKKEKEERLHKAGKEKTGKEKKAEKADEQETDAIREDEAVEKEYVTFEASSMENLLSHIQSYAFNNASVHVLADAERMVGQSIDFKG